MAGGKETPRQKLINLMYLVLLAMLALQVSAAIIQKFQFLNESLELTVKETEKRNTQMLVRMKASVEQNKSAPEDVALYKSAAKIRSATQDILESIRELKEDLIAKTGGRDELGNLKGLKEEEPVAAYMLGKGDSKNGKAYSLQKSVNAYIRNLNKNLNRDKMEGNYPDLALNGDQDPIFKEDPEQRSKDFAHLNFESTPLVAALAVLSEKENKILSIESEVLEKYAAQLGQFVIPVDKVRPVVMTPSNTVVAGTEFTAEMFMAAYSSNFSPEMTFNDRVLAVESNGVGQVKFRAKGGGYDPVTGIAKKTWRGSITYPKPGGGDSVYVVEHDYYVAKPVIEFKSAAVKALYQNSENKMTISVPALGANSNLSFQVKNARLINTGVRNEVRIMPTSSQTVSIDVYNDGVLLGTEKFKSNKTPKPTIDILVNGRPVDPVRGISVGKIARLKLAITPNEEFKKVNPRDVSYRPNDPKTEVLLVRNGNVRQRTTLKNIGTLRNSAQKGDRIVIEIKELLRKNFANEKERVSMPGEIFNIPITAG